MNLEFQFPDLQSFLWMNGHGPYVWSCYGVTFLAMALLILQVRWQRKGFIRQQRTLAQRSAGQQTRLSKE